MRISLPTHALIEFLGGFALLLAPFALGFGAAGTVVAVAAGVLLVGLALAGVGSTLALGAHRSFDQMLVAGLAGCGLVLALAGDPLAGLALAALAGVQLLLTSVTRWTRA
ncbi:MAG: hypothetical protein ACXW08_10530 [Solirubrobacteraceae bacterium]